VHWEEGETAAKTLLDPRERRKVQGEGTEAKEAVGLHITSLKNGGFLSPFFFVVVRALESPKVGSKVSVR
jgi:hypothetical protein